MSETMRAAIAGLVEKARRNATYGYCDSEGRGEVIATGNAEEVVAREAVKQRVLVCVERGDLRKNRGGIYRVA